MEEHKCENCCKVFTRKDNLNRHVRAVHGEKKLHECGICSRKFSRKQHKEWHLLTCTRNVQGGNLQRKSYKNVSNLKFTLTPGKTAFGGVFADWVIYFPDDYRLVDPVILLQTATKAMKETILKHNAKNTKQLKFTMSIHAIFVKACDPDMKTVPPVVLTTSPFTVYLSTDIDQCLDDAAEQLYKLIEEYEGCGSGWTIDYLERLDTTVTSFSSL